MGGLITPQPFKLKAFMADLSLKLIADQLGKSLENLAPQVEAEINQAVENLANATYASMIAKIQSMGLDPKNRQDYLRALEFQKLGEGTWIIFLNGDWATQLEEGIKPYSIKEKLLASTKTVQVGSRAGEPWVRKSKTGNRYAAVPFEHKPFSGEKSGDLAADIKKLTARNSAGKLQPLTKIFKDLEGKPLVGKVAVTGKNDKNPNLSNLTKYQFVSSKGAVSSIYMTYRMVSDSSSGWQHPGTAGYGIFKEAEAYVQDELENIIKTLV